MSRVARFLASYPSKKRVTFRDGSTPSASSSTAGTRRTQRPPPKDRTKFPSTIHVPIEMSLPQALKLAKRSRGKTTTIIIGETLIKAGRLVFDFPLKIIGEGTDKSIILGEMIIEGDKTSKKYISFSHLAIENPDGGGFWSDGGMNLHLDDVEIRKCKFNGIYIAFGATAILLNVHVHRCQTGLVVNGFESFCRAYDFRCHHNRHSGIWSSNAGIVQVYGQEKTSIHHNATLNTNSYGILCQHSGSFVLLHMTTSPSHDNTKNRDQLEKDSGAVRMVEGGNDQPVALFDQSDKIILRVPEDFPTLPECLVVAAEKKADIILLGEGFWTNVKAIKTMEQGTALLNERKQSADVQNKTDVAADDEIDGGPPFVIDFPIKIEGVGKKKTIIGFGIVIEDHSSSSPAAQAGGVVYLENLGLTNPYGVGVSSNNGIPLTMDTIDIYDCGDDGVRLTNGTSLTVVAGYVHNNGGSGIVIGEQIIPDDDKNNKNRNNKTTKSDNKTSNTFDDAAGGSGGSGGGGGASGQKEENDGWGDMSNTEEMKSKETEKELKDIPTADLTNCQLSCNNYSGLFVGDKSTVNIFGQNTEINHNANGNRHHYGVNIGRYATVNLHLDHNHPTIHYNLGGGNKNERLGGRCNVGCGSMSGLDRINGLKKK